MLSRWRQACHKGSFSMFRYFCSKGLEPLTTELEVEQWFENLSPEMQLKKRQVENDVALLKEKGYCSNVHLTHHDIKHLMIECSSFSAKQQYLNFLQKEQSSETNKRTKQEFEVNKNQKKDNETFNVKVDGVYRYTRNPLEQYKRLICHRSVMSVLNSPSPIVFDMDFDVSEITERRVCSQIENSVNLNRYFPEPCAIHITSFMKNSFLIEKYDTEYSVSSSNFMNFHEKGFEELFPLEKLVYLSPDAPPLRNHTPGDIYVIGGMLDEGGYDTSPLSLKKAQSLNIRCGSIPFVRYGIKPRHVKETLVGYVLRLDSVFEILLNINLKHQWEYVIKDTLKNRKMTLPIYKPIRKQGFL